MLRFGSHFVVVLYWLFNHIPYDFFIRIEVSIHTSEVSFNDMGKTIQYLTMTKHTKPQAIFVNSSWEIH